MFTLLDLLAPIGICLGAFLLCLYATFKASVRPAKIVALITGLVFLSGIPLFYLVRASGLKSDYRTKHMLGVKQGKLNTCPKEELEAWADEAIKIWKPYALKQFGLTDIENSLNGKLLVCEDEEKLSHPQLTMWIRGWSTSRTAAIGFRLKGGAPDKAYVKSLFKHEISHIILFSLGVPDFHHELFQIWGLGA